jgi:hypothetical protein
MANSIIINKGQGGLGAPLPGEDFISGYIHYTSATLPTGFSTASAIHEVFSVSDAEALGITDTHLGETLAHSTYTVSSGGITASQFLLSVNGVNLNATITNTANQTITQMGVALVAAINLLTTTTGYSATGTTATFSIFAPAGSGVGANSYTVATTATLGAAGSAGSFSGGAASQIDIIHYHISEYFRAQPKGDLYVGIYAQSSDYAEVTTMQNYATGKIRQVGVYSQSAFSTGIVGLLQTQVSLCTGNFKPLEAILQADFSATSDLTTLTDLHTLTDANVSVIVGQDGAAVGNTLWLATGKSIGQLGITLGAVSFASVSDDIGWVGKFNMSDGVENDTLAFANGTAYSSLSDGTITNIDGKAYLFLRKEIGIAGSYFDDSYTCIALTSDYCYMERNRTINKATRGLRSLLIPQLASPIKVNADGTLTKDVIGFYKALASRALDVMVSNNELSAHKITINPAQNVLSTGQLVLGIGLVPIGVARTIVVNIGFTL